MVQGSLQRAADRQRQRACKVELSNPALIDHRLLSAKGDGMAVLVSNIDCTNPPQYLCRVPKDLVRIGTKLGPLSSSSVHQGEER